MTSQELLKLLQQDAEKKAKERQEAYTDSHSRILVGAYYESGHASLHSDICALVEALSKYAYKDFVSTIYAEEALQKFYSKLEGK